MHDLETAMAASVAELVGHRLNDNDRWHLALVQRDEVWDQIRMRHLLDSLLANYPIGAVLLCRVKGSSQVIRVGETGRRHQEATPGAWQLLDGQQRINALFSIFSDQGDYGRFYLDMTVERMPPGPVQSRTSKDRALSYIAHLESPDDALANRDRFVDLSRWAAWAQSQKDLAGREVNASSASRILDELDPQFSTELTSVEAEIAASRLRQLIHLWTNRSVPVLRAEVASPLDVLEIFTRINLGGVNVLGADVYFAGVKTFWGAAGVDAEQRLDDVRHAAPFLSSRLQALRFISRLASRGLGRGDLLPLSVDRLAGDRGTLLLTAMDELTEAGSPVMQRTTAFCAWYATNSDLGYGLHQVTPELWDDVIAWAAASPRHDEEWYLSNKANIDAYLLGATLFGYRTVMGSPFPNLALLEALDAGSSGSPFPAETILSVAVARTQLRGPRGKRVLALGSTEDRSWLAKNRGWLLTSIAQQIPYTWHPEENFDWDHIFPIAEASRMWAPGQGRRRHHPDRNLINSTGNFWALNYSANRSLGRTVGESKFETLRRWASDPEEKFKVWPVERWSITDAEIDAFIEVDRLLNDDANSVERGMVVFKETVSRRSDRLLNDVLQRFPLVRRFAGDGEVLGDDPADSHRDYRDVLGIRISDHQLRGADADQARSMLKVRGDALAASIVERLEAEGLLAEHWVWHPRRKPQMGAWVAFRLVSGNCIELILQWTETVGASLKVKAYRRSPSALYPEFDHVPLGHGWHSENAEVVDAFMTHVRQLQNLHGPA